MNKLTDCKLGIVGAGSWGTALANMLSDKGLAVTMWVYESQLAEILKQTRINAFYLPDKLLNKSLHFTNCIEKTVTGKQFIVWVTPVKVFRKLFSQGLKHCCSEAIHVCASKGIEIESMKTVSQLAEEVLPVFAKERFAVLSGPSFAKEVADKKPTAVAVASRDSKSAQLIQQIMSTPSFRIYTTGDVRGVELGGALKNVIALAAGISDGLNLGHNTRAALITRGLAEIIRLGISLGANPLTFAGLSGIGDLVLTCTSMQSRNYSIGVEIGRGKSLEEIMTGFKMVAEGVYTARAAFVLSSKTGVEMPIVTEVYKVLFKNKSPVKAVEALMGRVLKQEKA